MHFDKELASLEEWVDTLWLFTAHVLYTSVVQLELVGPGPTMILKVIVKDVS